MAGDPPTTDERNVDKHDAVGFAGWLRMRADENRRVAALPREQWPYIPDVLKHLAFRFEQGAKLFEEQAAELERLNFIQREFHNLDDVVEIKRLTDTLAIQTVNAKALIDEQTKRRQAEVERDIAIQSIAELAETLRVVRNTQGGRFGLAWADVERMVNTTLGYPQQPDVTTLAASQTEMSPEAKRTLYGNMRDLYVSADDVPVTTPADPDYCSKCTPLGLGYCRCDPASGN